MLVMQTNGSICLALAEICLTYDELVLSHFVWSAFSVLVKYERGSW